MEIKSFIIEDGVKIEFKHTYSEPYYDKKGNYYKSSLTNKEYLVFGKTFYNINECVEYFHKINGMDKYNKN